MYYQVLYTVFSNFGPVMYVVDIRKGDYYQKCHDPDCRGDCNYFVIIGCERRRFSELIYVYRISISFASNSR